MSAVPPILHCNKSTNVSSQTPINSPARSSTLPAVSHVGSQPAAAMRRGLSRLRSVVAQVAYQSGGVPTNRSAASPPLLPLAACLSCLSARFPAAPASAYIVFLTWLSLVAAAGCLKELQSQAHGHQRRAQAARSLAQPQPRRERPRIGPGGRSAASSSKRCSRGCMRRAA